MIQRRYDSAAVSFGVVGPLLVAHYRSTPESVEHLEKLDGIQDKLVAEHGRISTCWIISQVGSMMRVSPAIRDKSLELDVKYEPHLRGSAIVIASKGIGAVMARGFLTTFFLLSRNRSPRDTFSSIAEGLVWLKALPEQHALVTGLSVSELEAFAPPPPAR